MNDIFTEFAERMKSVQPIEFNTLNRALEDTLGKGNFEIVSMGTIRHTKNFLPTTGKGLDNKNKTKKG